METPPNDIMIDITHKKIDKMTKLINDNGYTLYTHERGGTLQKDDFIVMRFFGGYGIEMSKNYGWDRDFAARAEIVEQIERSFEIDGAPWENESICNEKKKRHEEYINRCFKNINIRDSVLNFARSTSNMSNTELDIEIIKPAPKRKSNRLDNFHDSKTQNEFSSRIPCKNRQCHEQSNG